MTIITITTNSGQHVTARVSMYDDGELEEKLIHEDGNQEPYTRETLKAWLQKNEIELASWKWGFDAEFSDLYFAVFAAIHGSHTRQSSYSSLQIVD